jgi:hypothetical protein
MDDNHMKALFDGLCPPVASLRRLLVVLAVAGLCAAGFSWAKLETWRQEGAAAFAKHHRERVVISDQGRVRLGQALLPTGPLAAERVWDLVRARDGTVYAATGDSGKVFRQATKEGEAWTVALDAADTQALTLAATRDGKVFVGTGPTGQVIEVTDREHPASRPDPKVQYIWDLAADSEGNLVAATGPGGQLWKRSRDGKWSLVFDSKATHLLCVAVAPDGTIYAGSDGEGLIYRVNREGKVSVLYDAPQSEVRTLLLAPDGSLYAGTAAEAGGGGSRPPALLSHESAEQAEPVGSAVRTSKAAVPVAQTAFRGPASRGLDPVQTRLESYPTEASFRGNAAEGLIAARPPQPPASAKPSPPKPPAAGSAAPKPVSPGDNAVYRIDSDGVAREVFRAKTLVFGLCWAEDRLLVGTGPDGQLYEIRDRGAESTPLAKLDHGQILSLLAEPGGGILLGTGDPGAVVRLSSGFVPRGELVSEVYDAKLQSRFGALTWRADLPEGTAIALQVRSGNVGEPDETWSAWSAEQTDAAAARAESPPGRFVQYKVKMSTKDPAHTPELASVSLSFRSSNLPPEISKLEVPDLSAADGSTKQARLTLKWEVSDPNDDELSYTVQIKKDGWPSWITLTETPITEKTFAWDTTAFPSGYYRARLSASDRPSNSPDDALSRDRESPSFIVDHDPPQVTVTPREKKALIVLSDGLTRLVKADNALDGGPWTPLFPDDGLFDTLREQITLSLPELKPGVHLLMVRATDAAGNVGSGDSLIAVRN